VPVQVAGGVRNVRTATDLLDLGADRVLIGTAAFRSPELLDEFVAGLGAALAVSVDVRDGFVRVAGWLEGTHLGPVEAARYCVEHGVGRLVATSIERDGTLGGPDLDLYRSLSQLSIPVIAAGGVRHQADVEALAALGVEGVITGRAFAEGAFSSPST
jgi:phosphoribosylformimino-5-aminoimidazole carboxamide ribotide isomerase